MRSFECIPMNLFPFEGLLWYEKAHPYDSHILTRHLFFISADPLDDNAGEGLNEVLAISKRYQEMAG